MKRAVAYIRISQKDENIENQKMKIMDFAREKGFEIVGFFADIDVSGTTKPRDRPQYRAMLEFCKTNNIRTIIFYDLSRLARDVLKGLEELNQLAEEGYDIYFAGMDFLNYDLDPMMKKKVIMDFLWFAELYVHDIKTRTKVALERLKREGLVYTKPRLVHYIAKWLKGVEKFSDLSREDIERGVRFFKEHLDRCIEREWSIHRCWKDFVSRFKDVLDKTAPMSYVAFWREVKRLGYDVKFKEHGTSIMYRRRA